MPVISLVTAVLSGRHEYLGETGESLARQEMPSGWEWQWVVQEDGDTGVPLAALPRDRRISVGTGPRVHHSIARTIALSRVEGVLVRVLDADDLLPDGALKRDILALTSNPDAAWCVSPALDLMPDGELRPGPRDPDPGPLPRGLLVDGERRGLLPVLGTTVCTYTALVHALGGWQALPGAEDVALMLAVEAVSDGWMLAEPGLIYRRWPGARTFGEDRTVASASTPGRDVMLARVGSLHDGGWRWSPRDHGHKSGSSHAT
jgi:hypothetical protein